MELVQAFNAELSTLYESKPPISKGKMNMITKTAIKAIKMYKHIVQSVERFIAKCRPEYKVPGLYVIDSIVRQSRHQFGYDKDVFGPRFTRNFNQTFQNLFLACPIEDKPKIVRVLNLWQRNNVFSCDVIQPLLDMANPNTELKSNTPTEEQQMKDNQDKNIVMQLHQLASSLGGMTKGANGSNLNSSSNNDNQIRFNKKLLDFDYGDDDDDEKGETPTESEPLSTSMTAITNSDDLNANPLALSMAQNLLSNPELVQKLQQSIAMQSESGGMSAGSSFFNLNNSNKLNNDLTEQLYNLRDSLNNASSNNHQFNQLNNKIDKRDYDKQDQLKRRSVSPRKYSGNSSKLHSVRDTSKREDRGRDYRDRGDKRMDRRSDRRNSRERRHRSRSPRPTNKKDPLGNSFNSLQQVSTTSQLSPESKEKERERERRKKGLPCIKNNYATICSTTLWLGHLPKSTSEIDISDAFGEFGDINSIDLISARGCAYICMNRRQDAYKALTNLKNLELHNSHIKMAWAPGKGMKGKEFKDFWDKELGVSYIPYDKLTRETDFELLEDGGMLDEESIPKQLLDLINEKRKEDKLQQQQSNSASEQQSSATVEVVQPPIPPSQSKNSQLSQQQILTHQIPPPIPPPLGGIPPIGLGHGLPPHPIPPFPLPPIGLGHGLPPLPPHHLIPGGIPPPISLINHPHPNAPHPILPPLVQPPSTIGEQNPKDDQSNDPLRTPNKPPPNSLFSNLQPPSISLNSQMPNNPPPGPWISGIPPFFGVGQQPPPNFPSQQPPPNFASQQPPPNFPPQQPPPNFPPQQPPMNADDSFNNQVFEPNARMNTNPMMIPFQMANDDGQMHFNEMNLHDNFNWRNNKKDQRNNRNRFSNNYNNDNNNYNDQWNKRKSDNYNFNNSGNKKFKNSNQNKNINTNKKFNNKNKNQQRRFDQQENDRDESLNENESNDMDSELRNDDNQNSITDTQESRNENDTIESTDHEPVESLGNNDSSDQIEQSTDSLMTSEQDMKDSMNDRQEIPTDSVQEV